MFLTKISLYWSLLIIGVFRYPTCSEPKDVFWNYVCDNIKSTFNEISDSHCGVYKDCSCMGCGAVRDDCGHQRFTGT
jgi:hypothetical protein